MDYILTRRKGMKNLRLRLGADGSVRVSAPYGVPKGRIDEFVESRADWIERRRGEFSAPVSLSDGAAMTLFDRQLTVRVIAGEYGCREENGVLFVSVDDPQNAARVEGAVLSYMAERCRAVLDEAFRRFLILSGYAGERPTLSLKLMKSRWGSCNRGKNVVTLNLLLCKLPERFSYYVAAHEVTHLFIPNHSDAFYAFGEKLYPGFFETDRELNRIRVGSLFS